MVDAVRKGRTLSGGRVRFVLKETEWGYAVGVDLEEMVLYEPIVVLGKMFVQEFVPVGSEVSVFTAQRVRLLDDPLTGGLAGAPVPQMFPQKGASDEEFLTNLLNLDLDEMTAAIEDIHTGRIVSLVHDVKIASRRLGFAPRRLVLEDVAFVATKMTDESESNVA